ncbi:MAG TPA: DUF1579 family protein [Kofleriaceae bacterium]|jgi:hypothetical protein|nr:DUF1579 family protein [Kofleriaceae bacterium]
MKTFSKLVLSMCSTAALAAVATAQPAPATKVAPAPAKSEPKPVAGAPAMPPAAKAEVPAMPKPPAELASHLKSLQGSWRCTGSAPGLDGQPAPLKATIKAKSDLDGWFIQEVYDGTAGKMKYRFTSYTTYDAGSKKWRRVMLDSLGTQMIGTSDGYKDNKMDFNLDSLSPMGSGQFRDHVDLSDPKARKSWGEASNDKGKNWMKVYEMTCKK